MAKQICKFCGKDFIAWSGQGKICIDCRLQRTRDEEKLIKGRRVIKLKNAIERLEAELEAKRLELARLGGK